VRGSCSVLIETIVTYAYTTVVGLVKMVGGETLYTLGRVGGLACVAVLDTLGTYYSCCTQVSIYIPRITRTCSPTISTVTWATAANLRKS